MIQRNRTRSSSIGILTRCLLFATIFPVLADSPSMAQPHSKKAPRIGWVGVGMERNSQSLRGLRAGLSQLGRTEGKNYILEQRWWDGHSEGLTKMVDDLVAAKVDVIVAQGLAVYGTKHVSDIPVVFGFSGDPVAAGIAKSYSNPDGNKTGATYMSVELNGKRLGLLKEVLPHVKRVAILANPQHPGESLEIAEIQAAGRRIGVSIHYLPVRSVGAIKAALAAIIAEGDHAIIAVPDALLGRYRGLIGEFAIRERIPVVYGWPAWIDEGGLFTYGPNPVDAWPRIAIYVDKILSGKHPRELPIERPARFEFVISLKTARSLGVSIPSSILLRADRVIE